MCCRLAESMMTPEEQDMVQKLRETVKDDLSVYYDTDFNLLRWLQGHNYNMESVTEKLRHHLRFRKCWDLDSWHERDRDHPIQAHWPAGLTGLSGKIDHSIVFVEPTGTIDHWGMMQTYSALEAVKPRLYELEKMLFQLMKHERETGHQASIIFIMDLHGLQFNRQLLSLVTGPLKCLVLFMNEHYVELIKYFVFVNTPSFFAHLYRILHPLVPDRTAKKARVLGSDWRREILKYSNPSALPEFWNVDGDRHFTAQLERGTKFDESKYNTSSISGEHTQLQVGAGKKEFISISAVAGAKLTWSLFADGEFGFGIFYSSDPAGTDETNMEMVYPQFHHVVAPTSVPVEDALICEKAGVYKFLFDNRTAWWYTLNIHHKISLL